MSNWVHQIKNTQYTVGDFGDKTFEDPVITSQGETTYGELTFEDVAASSYTNRSRNNSSWDNQDKDTLVTTWNNRAQS